MEYVPVIVVLTASIAAVVTDIREFKVYNVLTLPLLALGLIYGAVLGDGFLLSLGAAALGFGILIIPYAAGAMAAGDVKLLAAFGAWLGFKMTLCVAGIGCLLTGLYAVFVMVRRGGLKEAWINLQIAWYRMHSLGRHLTTDEGGKTIQELSTDAEGRKHLIPFSVMLAAGVVITLIAQFFFKLDLGR